MRRQGTLTALVTVAAFALLSISASATASAATSTIAFTTCADAHTFGCGHLTVPLDPSGAIPGTLSLAVRRQLAATGTATEAVVALAGGPGQAAIPFAGDAAQFMSAALQTRDLIVFDQRGTGYSGPLKCPALNSLTAPISTVIPTCAMQIGATRGLYTTDDTVADLEALRVALGYTKLVIYGTSYGTKVALRYAAAYPNNVAGLILDSTVTVNGPDVFDQSSYQAVPRILGDLCAGGACPGIANPEGDLQSVLATLARSPVTATYALGTGKVVKLKIHADDLAAVLIAGDEDQTLRADFPAAVAAAAHGQYGLLAILVAHAVYAPQSNNTVDNPLFFDTECEELPFPWQRSATPADRGAAALAAAQALPAGSFGPFSARTAYDESSAPACAYWPFASAAPEATVSALPNVPTLIISGGADLRTPTSNALAVKAMIPDATVVVVPQTGHSVLSTEFGTCASDAVTAFFTAAPINTNCTARKPAIYLRPAPAAPSSLHAVTPLPGIHGNAGRTARALELTLGWTSREISESYWETLIGSYNPAFTHGLGGIYGGYAKLKTAAKTLRTTFVFHHFSYVRGLTVTGSLSNGIGRLAIGGTRAANGTLVAAKFNDFVGTLGGVRVHFTISRAEINVLTAAPRRR